MARVIKLKILMMKIKILWCILITFLNSVFKICDVFIIGSNKHNGFAEPTAGRDAQTAARPTAIRWAKRNHMESTDQKYAIAANVLENIASMPKVTSATAPVFCLDRLNKPKFLASAVLLKVKDCYFALTAGHVLDERRYSDLYIGSGNKVVLLNGPFGSTVSPDGGNRQQDKIDIGIVRLSKEIVQDMREDEFLSIEDTYNLHTATTTGHYMFTGYPYSKHKRAIKKGQAEATPYSFASVPAPLTDYQDSGLDPRISLLLQFDKKKLWFSTGRVEGPDPKGLSGGGVWFLNNVFSTKTLRPLLVAIAIEKWKLPKPKCVLSTKIHVALSIIWDHFPELRT